MTEQLPPEDRDQRELEQFLARRSPLSQRYRDAADEQAPRELEMPLLQLARDELRHSREIQRLRRLRRWTTPLAAAASLVLVVSLAWTLREQQGTPMNAVAPQAAMPAPAAARLSTDQPPAPTPPVQAKPEEAPLKKALEPRRPRAAAAPSSGSPLPRENASAAPVPAPPPPVPVINEDALAAPAAAPKPLSMPAPAAMAAPAAPAPIPQAPAAAQANRNSYMAKAAEAVPPACTAPQRNAALAQAAPERGADIDDWLTSIRHLRDAPDLEGARAELACFVAARPQALVPEDLKGLLP